MLEARAVVRETIREGEIFIAMHDVSTNRLTFPAFDSYSRQPSYKYCAVRIEGISSSSSAAVSNLNLVVLGKAVSDVDE